MMVLLTVVYDLFSISERGTSKFRKSSYSLGLFIGGIGKGCSNIQVYSGLIHRPVGRGPLGRDLVGCEACDREFCLVSAVSDLSANKIVKSKNFQAFGRNILNTE